MSLKTVVYAFSDALGEKRARNNAFEITPILFATI